MNDGLTVQRTELAVAATCDNGSTRKPPAVAPGLSKDEVERRLKLYGTTAPDQALGRTSRRPY